MIGADGRRSLVAREVGAEDPRLANPNQRGCYFAYWRDARADWRSVAAQWRAGEELATAFPCDVRRFRCCTARGVRPLLRHGAASVRLGRTAERHRLDRGGNRQLNAALHRIAITQARVDPRARAFLHRKRAEGKTDREARRALKRHLANAVYRQLEQWAENSLLANST